jgi:hypothetical protein
MIQLQGNPPAHNSGFSARDAEKRRPALGGAKERGTIPDGKMCGWG